jgi:hypothetical protein
MMHPNGKTTRTFRPLVNDRLEPRLALNGASVVALVQASIHGHKIALRGRIQGRIEVVNLTTTIPTFVTDPTTGQSIPGPILIVTTVDAATPLVIQGQGHVKPLGHGHASLTGTLYEGGYRPEDSPDISGTLTLSGRRGSVVMSVTGGVPTVNTQASYHLTYKITSGTKAFAHAKGSGSMLLETPLQSTTTFSFSLKMPDKLKGK